ncbi:ChrR family anti-sigma-E factor [Shinella sp.]|uniref:ChrR family anti-sigma-E factor n=1 Tax=unclassified Shinella TaxID=2643062 RepID=UPI0028AF4372|nr:ChrR family anti-sigma-E factor [Shinella sp.]
MSQTHHATEETLMRHAAGTLAAGPAIVVAAHLASCPSCRARIGTYEALGGALIEDIEPAALSPTALSDALAMLDAEEGAMKLAPPPLAPLEIGGILLPESLRGCDIGRWRWIGPGMKMSRVGVPQDPEANLILLKVGPGRALPDHGHVGTEFTYIVSGSFTDRFGKFQPGDLAEMGEDIEHQPVVDADGDCICLAAMEGKMRFKSVIGRMLQPIFGI